MKIITISREYGTGGREIGLAVAKEFGVELYDRDIIRKTAKESGLDYDYLANEAENISKTETFLRRITPMQYDQKDSLFDMQREIILDFAAKGPCVILGRCADAILDDAGYDCFHIFLYADEIFRGINIGQMIGSDDAALIKRTMRRIDNQRRTHYERYSGRRWGDYKNYNMMLDCGSLSSELCVEMIVRAIRSSEE